jgi:hypothetical protein
MACKRTGFEPPLHGRPTPLAGRRTGLRRRWARDGRGDCRRARCGGGPARHRVRIRPLGPAPHAGARGGRQQRDAGPREPRQERADLSISGGTRPVQSATARSSRGHRSRRLRSIARTRKTPGNPGFHYRRSAPRCHDSASRLCRPCKKTVCGHAGSGGRFCRMGSRCGGRDDAGRCRVHCGRARTVSPHLVRRAHCGDRPGSRSASAGTSQISPRSRACWPAARSVSYDRTWL